jgi:L-ascorbate metabolism protein UlaG (beta-lactamase superfamily)
MIRGDGVTVDWLGYATARLAWDDGTVAYTDPGRYGVLTGEWTGARPHPPATDYDERDGDVVVVTHAHHYDPDGIRRVAAEDAVVVVYESVHAPSMDRDVDPVDDLEHEVVRVDDESDLLANGVVVRSVAAATDPDDPENSSHPPGFGCGFLLTHDGRTAFWPGDSDVLDGHAELDVDVFLPPLDHDITMTEGEAAELAAALDPRLVVPIHYNTGEFLAADSASFAADVAGRGVPVALDER